ncbi:MAG: hypothetical protein NTV34_19495 [Proteobacteria bacterium]|nr:hypothetical protein [Pseudomonadota bacterium]
MIVEDKLLQLVEPHLTEHVIKKFQGNGIESVDVEACYLELLKFLFLTSKHPELRGSFIPVTKKIDDFWHEVILQTRYYQKLCQNLPSGEFIHHESMHYDSYKAHKSKDQLIKEILRWITLYVANFGDFRADRVQHWFFVSRVMRVLNLDLHSLNAYAKNPQWSTSVVDMENAQNIVVA